MQTLRLPKVNYFTVSLHSGWCVGQVFCRRWQPRCAAKRLNEKAPNQHWSAVGVSGDETWGSISMRALISTGSIEAKCSDEREETTGDKIRRIRK